jgi:hypothetical protein
MLRNIIISYITFYVVAGTDLVFRSTKVYTIIEDESLESLARGLRGKKTSKVFTDPEGEERDLVSAVEELEYDEREGIIRGHLRMDTAKIYTDRDGEQSVGYGLSDAPFFIVEGSTRLMVRAKKVTANTTANTLSRLLWGRTGHILEKFFETNHIQAFLSRNPHIPEKIMWAGLTLPGTNSATLEGSDVSESPDYAHYDTLGGSKRFVRVRLNDGNISLSLSDEGIVTFYSPLDDGQIEAFLIEKVCPVL